ncbi:MAG: NUDIX domain-containing protein [Sandaracinaceae bacterium]
MSKGGCGSRRGCGHGHVYPNPDGSRARCGGPLLCSRCALDLTARNREQAEARAAEDAPAPARPVVAIVAVPGPERGTWWTIDHPEHGVCLPGFKVEPGEHFERAAVRALRESAGLEVVLGDLRPIGRGLVFGGPVGTAYELVAFIATGGDLVDTGDERLSPAPRPLAALEAAELGRSDMHRAVYRWIASEWSDPEDEEPAERWPVELPEASLRVAVVGPRTYAHPEAVRRVVERLPLGATVVSSGGGNVGRTAEETARERSLGVQIFPAERKRWGKAAGTVRNMEIARSVDHVIAFWDGNCNGTLDTIRKAVQAGATVEIHPETVKDA